MRLAQLNIGRLVADQEAPEVAEFMDALDRVNALAESSDGFVWRLRDDTGNATSFRIARDRRLIPNLSVWTDIASLRDFMYQTEHVDFLRRRREWFEPLEREHLVLWWIDDGHQPSLDEALDRLERLERDGPTAAAFTFRVPFAPDGSPLVRKTSS